MRTYVVNYVNFLHQGKYVLVLIPDVVFIDNRYCSAKRFETGQVKKSFAIRLMKCIRWGGAHILSEVP